MDEEHQDGHFAVSPLVIALLGIMSGAVLIGILHCMMAGSWCNTSQTQTQQTTIPTTQRLNDNADNNHDEVSSNSTSTSTSTSRLQRMVVAPSIGKSLEPEVCVVCLSRFEEGDIVRVLPQCAHMFHVPCIEKWLAIHSNCPLCRAKTASPRLRLASLPEELFRFPDFGC